MQIRVFTDPSDQTVRVELQGSTLISNSQAFGLMRGSDASGADIVLFESGTRAQPVSGVLGGLEQLSGEILPAALNDLNDLTSTMIRQFNAVHAVGLSHTYSQSLHSSATRIDTKYSDDNLDDPVQALQLNSDTGIFASFLPSFTDASGNAVARNLTINVFDEVNGSAQKFIVRYEPGSTIPVASRSLDDLVEAINTGTGGGFTVHPPRLGGVAGVTARTVSVSGGLSLQLDAGPGFSIDFSSALDLRPADAAWTGSGIGVNGVDLTLAGSRLAFEVANGGTELQVFRFDPVTGERTGYPGAAPAVVDLTDPAGSVIVNGLTITFTPTGVGGQYQDGEGFSAAFDATGTVAHAEAATWSSGNAGFMLSGRYTGAQTFEPGREWSMQVLRDGVIGASSDLTGPNGPPVVEFSYYVGPAGAGVLQTVQVTLDESSRAGDQVRIADGVYAIFDAGRLTAGDNASFTVDAEPDQAGLLAALGLNNLFDGNDANDIRVAAAIAANPGSLAVSKTRSAGDNSNLLDLIQVREAQVFGPSQASLDEFYQAQVSEAAVRTQQNSALLRNQELVQLSLQNRRDAVSGVSIDEEVGQLIQQQQAYGAAARVISIAKENIDTLLSLVGG
jgi:flagellar hook-associated protein FlgK